MTASHSNGVNAGGRAVDLISSFLIIADQWEQACEYAELFGIVLDAVSGGAQLAGSDY